MVALRPIYKWKAELLPQPLVLPPLPPSPLLLPLLLNFGTFVGFCVSFFLSFFFFIFFQDFFCSFSWLSICFFHLLFICCCFCFIELVCVCGLVCDWPTSSTGGAATVFRLVIYYSRRFQLLPSVFHGQMPPIHFQRPIS